MLDADIGVMVVVGLTFGVLYFVSEVMSLTSGTCRLFRVLQHGRELCEHPRFLAAESRSNFFNAVDVM